MKFVKAFSDGFSLLMAAHHVGMDYKKTGVEWAKSIGDIIKQGALEETSNMPQLEDGVGLRASLFGKNVNIPHVNPNLGQKGMDLWLHRKIY